MNESNMEKLLEVEFKNLYEKYWADMLKKDYEVIKNKKYHLIKI